MALRRRAFIACFGAGADMLQFSFDEIENRIQLTQRALVFGRVTQEDVQCADVEDSDPETRATAACSRSAVTLSTWGPAKISAGYPEYFGVIAVTNLQAVA